jgi:hypothetical protein
MTPKESLIRRIVVEYGRSNVYAYFTDGNGKILDEEAWQQPFKLEVKEAHEEAKDVWDFIYQELQDTVLCTASDADEGDSVDEPEED